MKDNPRYTVAIPAFKGAYLKTCIDSVLAQTVHDYELVIVNDCSPDAIDGLISSYSDGRIRYYKNETNAGAEHMVNNWNRCLSLAKGEYFVLLGDDDFLDVDYLQSFDELIALHPALEVYHCRSKIVDESGKTIDLTPPCPNYETVYDNMYYRLSMSRIQYISDFVYHTASLKEKGGFFNLPLAWGSDDITSFRACAAKGIAHCNKPVFNYRESPITITRSGNVRKKMEAIMLQKDWFKQFLQVAPVDALEQISYQKLLCELDAFLLRRKADIIKGVLREQGFAGVKYWLQQAKKYGVSKLLVMRIYLAVIREKKK